MAGVRAPPRDAASHEHGARRSRGAARRRGPGPLALPPRPLTPPPPRPPRRRPQGYSAAAASQLLQIFKGTVFVTPLLGAYLADAHLGRWGAPRHARLRARLHALWGQLGRAAAVGPGARSGARAAGAAGGAGLFPGGGVLRGRARRA